MHQGKKVKTVRRGTLIRSTEAIPVEMPKPKVGQPADAPVEAEPAYIPLKVPEPVQK